MEEIRLTKDADVLLCALYKEYLEQRNRGVRKFDARVFLGPEWIQANLTPKWTVEDISDTCRELAQARMLECSYGDDEVCGEILTTDGIIYMENRFKNGLASVFSYLETLRSFLPW